MPLKILFLSHSFYPDIGGIEINSEILADSFSKAGHEVRLLTWSADTTGKVFAYTVVRNPGIKKLFKEHAWADIVFENNPCIRLAWPGVFFGRPSVVALNTWISREDGQIGLQDRLKFLWLKRASKVIAVSDALRKRCWVEAVVIRNPYKVNDFKLVPGVDRSNEFVFLGRLVSDKGVEMAIRAIHLLVTSGFNKKPLLTIIGDGPERVQLERLTNEISLNEFVHFKGSLRGKELTACLNQHKFILVPSVWEEPFGNVALEGMACGCLPIVSDGGGLKDAVGNAGLVFERGNVEALVNCIKNIYDNQSLQQQLKNAAIGHLTAHHPDVISQLYMEVIYKAAGHVS